MTILPPTIAEPIYNTEGFGVGFRISHPSGVECVFPPDTKQCSCGRLDLGVVPALSDEPPMDECVCQRFSDTGGYRIADLTCPVHGVNGSDPGDGYWGDSSDESATEPSPDPS